MTIEQITLILAVIVTIAAAIKLIFVWKSKKEAKRVLATILLITVATANIAIFFCNNIITQYFSQVEIDEAALDEATLASKSITTEIAQEGIVLLKNENNVLPLVDEKKINLFGISSIDIVYGGSGSGASDESNNVTLQEGLEQAGFEVNSALTQFYTDNQTEGESTNIFNLKGGDYNIYEPLISAYSDTLIADAKAFSDIAIYVVSRNGGEGGDLPMDMAEYQNGDAGKHYLELQAVEVDVLNMLEENFGTVIVLINSSNAMELGFLENETIDGALWIGGPGATGCIAVGEILKGSINPSGRLTDIYAYDLTTAPSYYNTGDYSYVKNGENTKYKYVEYQEGIYVGYRYYETRYVDNETGECNENAYDVAVQYPFGYGLSYSDFSQEIVSSDIDDSYITTVVKVTNQGEVAGKEVVQLYVTPPYTEGGIEKSAISLIAFDKTELLKSGESEEIELKVAIDDLASYDYIHEKGYVLEAGVYEVKLMENSHDLIDSFEYEVKETMVYDENNVRESDITAATNQFEDAAGDIVYVSRSDWEGTLPTSRVLTKEITSDIENAMNYENIETLFCKKTHEKSEDIITGAKTELSIADMIGLEYNDPKWDELLNSMSLEDMTKLIGFGGFSTIELSSIGLTSTIDIDGPAGLNALTSSISGVQYTSEPVLASTFNADLAKEMGVCYANEAVASGVTGLYAPGVNIHRSPFGGRNFEYYSEDPLLSGKIGAAEVAGMRQHLLITYPKHFALNDQESNRIGIAVWSNEQAIREIYLKAFEILVKEGKTNAIMSSYNRIGTTWAGGHSALLQNVLREEWGFVGIVVTDYVNGKHMSADQSILNGGDLMLSSMGHQPTDITTSTEAGRTAIREATKNILYTIANSRAYVTPVTMVTPYWLIIEAVLDGIFVLWVIVSSSKRCRNMNVY